MSRLPAMGAGYEVSVDHLSRTQDIYYNYTGFGLDDEGLKAKVEAAQSVIEQQPENSTLILVDIRGTPQAFLRSQLRDHIGKLAIDFPIQFRLASVREQIKVKN